MFTGIIECMGEVVSVQREADNLHLWVKAPFTQELSIDQSIAHNGCCLTVVELREDTYRVTVIAETLQRSNLKSVRQGNRINLERALRFGDRLDGHLVQGHVDTTALCEKIESLPGSHRFIFRHAKAYGKLTVEKGSVCVNGVSLTLVDVGEDYFSVALIPYTFENTNFAFMKEGDMVNVEFDVIGKYVAKLIPRMV